MGRYSRDILRQATKSETGNNNGTMNGRLLVLSALCTCMAVVVTNIKLATRHVNVDSKYQDDSPFIKAHKLNIRSTSRRLRNQTDFAANNQTTLATVKQLSGLPSSESSKIQEIFNGHHYTAKTSSSKIDTTGTPNSRTDSSSKVGGLGCSAYGGPMDTSEMIYWRDVPEDDHFKSPYHTNREKYITFEPDEGGFNNVRMALETVVSMAVIMGRTLVLPPSQELYLLTGDNRTKQRNHFGVTDFYPLEAVAREHNGLKIISMADFLQKRELLVNHTTGEAIVPSRINWEGSSKAEIWELHQWLRWVGRTPTWSSQCIVAFAPHPRQEERLLKRFRRIQNTKLKDVENLAKHSTKRIATALAHRRHICMYDTEWQSTKVIHFTGDIASGTRMLIHFYAYLFFADPSTERLIKRFVRDHLRYVDEIQCAAGRVVEAMRVKARFHSVDGKDGAFDTLHVRRGDFKVVKAILGAEEIYANIIDVMIPNSTLYIATDEVNRSFFEPFLQHHQVYFLSDFDHLLTGLNTNYYGLVEQLVAARGRIFVGCMYSTFSSFVMRLRGYHSTHDMLPGFQSGVLPTTYYYTPLRFRDIMHNYTELSKPMTYREFPIAWTDIDEAANQSDERTK